MKKYNSNSCEPGINTLYPRRPPQQISKTEMWKQSIPLLIYVIPKKIVRPKPDELMYVIYGKNQQIRRMLLYIIYDVTTKR